MAKKEVEGEKVEEGSKEEQQHKKLFEPRKLTALEQMRQIGYNNYSVAEKFGLTNLSAEQRPYAVAKKVELMAVKEEDGGSVYLALGFVGVLDEKLYLIAMRKDDLMSSAMDNKANPNSEYVGIEFFSVSRGFGPIGLIAMPRAAYLRFIDAARSLK